MERQSLIQFGWPRSLFFINSKYAAKIFIWIAALSIGALDIYVKRNKIGTDGVSYVEIAKAYADGRWSDAINALWSPLYCWVLAIVFWAAQPALDSEIPWVQFVNYLCYLFQLICFSLFLSTLLRGISDNALDAWIWILTGCLFVWSNTVMYPIHRVGPDSLATSLIFIAFTLILHIRNGKDDWSRFLSLGVVLGFCYYAKSPMFPLGFLYITCAGIIAPTKEGRLKKIIGSFAVFLLVSSPFIVALSLQQGHITFSEAGRLNYLWRVNQISDSHFQGDAIHGQPVHPTRKIHDSPPVYEFGTPIDGTYPVWYDPAYWYKGVRPSFDLNQQINAIQRNLLVLVQVFNGVPGLIAFLLFLAFKFGRHPNAASSLKHNLPLIILSVLSISAFLVVHLEPRYINPFLLAIFVVLISSLNIERKKVMALLVIAMTFAVISSIGIRQIRNYREVAYDRVFAADSESLQLLAGEKIGTLFSASSNGVWAHTAGVQIVAEVDSSDSELFWNSPDDLRDRVFAAFATAGVDVVVSEQRPKTGSEGWQPLAKTSYYAVRLNR